MTKRVLKDWLSAYMEYSQFSEAPDKFHFWTGVSAIAGALRRRVWIDMGYFQWTPNFYIIFVAPPGIVSKSTTASIGMNLLRKVPGVHFGPDTVTWQALAQALAASTEMFPYEGMEHPMSAITIESSEFGNFLNPADREMVDMLVSLWDSRQGTYKKSTKTMGDDIIENPWINVIACTTPAWISGNFPDYMIGGGFTSRCVFVYGEKKRQYIAYPQDHIPSTFEHQRDQLIHDLEHISVNLVGRFTLTKEAKTWGEEWYEEHYTTGLESTLNNDKFAGYLARKQTHIHKLAMILSASARDDLVITKDTLSAANDVVTTLEQDMPLVFSQIGMDVAAKQTTSILGTIRAARKIDRAELYRHMFRVMPYREFQMAIEGLIAAGLIKQIQDGNVIYVSYVGDGSEKE